jgi:HEAT repeat protein
MTETTIEGLLLLVGDQERGGKDEALGCLLARGLEQVYPDLERALRDNANADLRNGAMETLVRFGEAVVPRLVRLLDDADEEVRNFTTVMLGTIGSRKAVPHLIEALRDRDANVRHGAAEALGRIGDRRALQPLLPLLEEDFWQQYPAVVALGELGDERAVPHLLKHLSNDLLASSINEALNKIRGGHCPSSRA